MGFKEVLEDILSFDQSLFFKKMFGGYGLYKNGLMVGIVDEETMFLRVKKEDFVLEKSKGCLPFSYESRGKTIELLYIKIEDEELEDEMVLAQKLKKGLEAALEKETMQKDKSPRKKKRSRDCK